MNAVQLEKLKSQVAKYGMSFCTSAEFYSLVDIAEKYFKMRKFVWDISNLEKIDEENAYDILESARKF